MNSALMFSKASDEWETPQELYDQLDAEFKFDIDVAATQENEKCGTWLDMELDALDPERKSWLVYPLEEAPTTVWLNPPYSKVRQFMARAALEAEKGCTVVCLVPSRTDTRWWHEYVWNAETHQPRPGVEVRFLKGRLKFGNAQNSAPFPSVVIIFRPPA